MAEKKRERGFLSVLKDLVVEEVTDDGEKPSPSVPRPATEPVFSMTAPDTSTTPVFQFREKGTGAQAVDSTLLAEVEQALGEKSPSAYHGFLDILNSLASAVPDEKARFAAAIVMAGRTGIKLADVRTAYEARVGIVDQLYASFDAQSKKALAERLKDAQDKVSLIDQDLERSNAEIARLTAHVAEQQRLKQEASVSMEAKRGEIETVRTKMVAVFDVVRDKVTTERDILSRNTNGGNS